MHAKFCCTTRSVTHTTQRRIARWLANDEMEKMSRKRWWSIRDNILRTSTERYSYTKPLSGSELKLNLSMTLVTKAAKPNTYLTHVVLNSKLMQRMIWMSPLRYTKYIVTTAMTGLQSPGIENVPWDILLLPPLLRNNPFKTVPAIKILYFIPHWTHNTNECSENMVKVKSNRIYLLSSKYISLNVTAITKFFASENPLY
jgi:hypothetical protein